MSVQLRYQIGSPSAEGIDVDRIWFEALSCELCHACQVPLGEFGMPEIRIDSALPDGPIDFVAWISVGVVRHDLLNEIGRQLIDENLILGRVLKADGTLIPDWNCFFGRELLVVRGGPNSESDRCEGCGKLFYTARGKTYLTQAQIKSGREIYEEFPGGLLVSATVARRVLRRPWKHFYCDEIPVLDVPLDGLPAALSIKTKKEP